MQTVFKKRINKVERERDEGYILGTTEANIVYGRRYPHTQDDSDSSRERNEDYAKLSDRDLLAGVMLYDEHKKTCDGALSLAKDRAEIERELDSRAIDDMAERLPEDSPTKADWQSLSRMKDDELLREYGNRLDASKSDYINKLIKSTDAPPFDLKNDAKGEAREQDDAVMRARSVADARGLTDDWRLVEAKSFVKQADGLVKNGEREIDQRPNANELHYKLAQMRDERDRKQDTQLDFNEDHERRAGPSRDRNLTPAGPRNNEPEDERKRGRDDAEFLGREASHVLPQGERDRQRDVARLEAPGKNPEGDRRQEQKLEPEMTKVGSSSEAAAPQKTADKTPLEKQIARSDQSYAQHKQQEQHQHTEQEPASASRKRR